MSDSTKQVIENMISYYDNHSVEAMAKSGDERLLNIVIEDFEKLLCLLDYELSRA